MVNEELTAEEWKRRYERERDKCARLRGLIERYEAELARWRHGQLFCALVTLPSNRQHLSIDDCLESNREQMIRTAMCCIVYKLCTVILSSF